MKISFAIKRSERFRGAKPDSRFSWPAAAERSPAVWHVANALLGAVGGRHAVQIHVVESDAAEGERLLAGDGPQQAQLVQAVAAKHSDDVFPHRRSTSRAQRLCHAAMQIGFSTVTLASSSRACGSLYAKLCHRRCAPREGARARSYTSPSPLCPVTCAGGHLLQHDHGEQAKGPERQAEQQPHRRRVDLGMVDRHVDVDVEVEVEVEEVALEFRLIHPRDGQISREDHRERTDKPGADRKRDAPPVGKRGSAPGRRRSGDRRGNRCFRIRPRLYLLSRRMPR